MRIKALACILITTLVGANLSAAQESGDAARIAPRSAKSGARYGELPLIFEANRGQAAGQVKFLSRGSGYTAFLTTGGMVLTLRPSRVVAPSKAANQRVSSPKPATSTTLQFQLVGANKNPAVVGEDAQPGRINYFIGNDASQWHTNLPTYARVRYKNVYPGIDLLYYGNHQQLEYDFAVAPGADPRQIEFQIVGASQLALDGQGNLILKTSNGELHFKTPIVYQESNGQRAPVDGGYIMKNPTHVGFQVASYDPNKALVIDPVLEYSTYLGGSGTDQPSGIVVDGSGSVYIAGYTNSADFPLSTQGSAQISGNHVFVAKLDASGSNLVYATYIGGNSEDYGIALVLDKANNVYVAGSTESSNFPVVKPYQAQQPGPYSGFLSKVSADGSALLYSTYLGGNSFDQPTGVAIDGFGQAFVAGYTMSRNFPVANGYQTTVSANQGGIFGDYGFLTKFSSDGSSLVFSTYLAGNSNVVQDCGSPCWPAPYNAISAVAVDANGNAYVTGSTNTYNFPVTSGAYLATNSAPQDASVGFVSKFNGAGSLDYSTYFYGSSGNPVGIGPIAVDGSGSAYIAGSAVSDGTFPITSTGICDPGTTGFGCSYAFVAKFDPTGSTLMYSTFLGPNNYANPQAIVLDANNDAYVVASTSSTLLRTMNAIEPAAGGTDVLLVEIDPAATTQLFATYLGGGGNDLPSGLALGADGALYMAGTTNSADFPTMQGAFQTVLGGGTDAFVVKIGSASAAAVSLTPGSLQYASLPVGSTSQPQTVLLRNMGSSPLSISSITAGGDFAETDNCLSGVPAAGSCTISVTFTPTAAGSRSGSIVIQDDAAGSPHSITLSGIGSAASVTLSPATLTFPSVSVGSSSASQTITLTNTGNSSLSISSVQVTGDFGQTNNCPATLTSGSSCTINIVFTPTSSGTRSGTLTVTDSAQTGSQTVSLTGSASVSDFAVSTSVDAVTVKAGNPATYSLTVSPVAGSFPNPVSLSCSGLPSKATCTFSPATVTPGTKAASVTLTVNTSAAAADKSPAIPSPTRPATALMMQIQGFGVFGMLFARSKKRSKRIAIFVLLAVLVLGMLFMSGCAGGTGIASQGSGSVYTVTVTGTSGTLQHSLPLTLTIQ